MRIVVASLFATLLSFALIPGVVPNAHARKPAAIVPPPPIAQVLCCPPDTTVRSSDGRFVASSWRLRQEGNAVTLLFEDGQVMRIWTGLRAVAWEPEGTRLLVVESKPGHDLDYYIIDPAAAGDDALNAEPPRLFTVAKTSERFLAWKQAGELVFQNVSDPDVQRSVWIKKKDD